MAEEVNVEKILQYRSEPELVSYNQRDLLIYALGIGETDLKFTYELHDSFEAFPTYPVVLSYKGDSSDVIPFPPPSAVDMPDGMPIVNPAMILHGEQSIELMRPLRPDGETLKSERRIVSLLDKGKGALMETETILKDLKTGKVVAKLVSGVFIRGLTGFQGRSIYSKRQPLRRPSRKPDAVRSFYTQEWQTLLYRLSGDYNPLHIDPEIAQSVGFNKPILHGLCSMGIAARSIYHEYCQGDAKKLTYMRVRFSKPCYPGETLVTSLWANGNDIIFETSAKERDIVILVGECTIARVEASRL